MLLDTAGMRTMNTLNENPEREQSFVSVAMQARDKVLKGLLKQRHGDGSWKSRFDSYAFPAALYITMLRTTGLIDRTGSIQEEIGLVLHLLGQVNLDGGFYKYPSSPSSRNVTRVVALSLKLVLGDIPSRDRPARWYRRNDMLDGALESRIRKAVERAENYLKGSRYSRIRFELDHSLISRVLIGHVMGGNAYSSLPFLPFYRMALNDLKPCPGCLYPQFNRIMRRILPALSVLHLKALERRGYCSIGDFVGLEGLRRHRQEEMRGLARVILGQQNKNGGWLFNACYAALNVMALVEAGIASDDPAILRAHEHLRRRMFSLPGGGLAMNVMDSDIWDTSHGICSYLETSGKTACDESIRPALGYLLAAQAEDGGFAWGRGYDNDTENDSTAFALSALAKAGRSASEEMKPRIEQAKQLALSYLLARQGKSGGWSVWDKTGVRCRPGSIGFLQQIFFDAPSPDQTARVLSTLAEMGLPIHEEPARRALDFFLKTQCRDGSWWSRWWASYIPGTCWVLLSLSGLGFRYDSEPLVHDRLFGRVHKAMARGVHFLLDRQNRDGGWGEGIQADSDRCHAGRGKSTAAHTAFTISTLIRCGYPPDDPAIRKAVHFLLATQDEEGSWPADQAFFTLFARSFYYSYPFHGWVLPLNALNDCLNTQRAP